MPFLRGDDAPTSGGVTPGPLEMAFLHGLIWRAVDVAMGLESARREPK